MGSNPIGLIGVNMRKVVRFYGSCGHTLDEESEERFDKANKSLRELGWSKNSMYHIDKRPEVTVEGDKTIVHIHPMRYSCCRLCIRESMIIDQLESLEQELRDIKKKIEEV